MQKFINRILNLFNRPPSNHPGCGKSRIVWKWALLHGVRYRNVRLVKTSMDDMRGMSTLNKK